MRVRLRELRSTWVRWWVPRVRGRRPISTSSFSLSLDEQKIRRSPRLPRDAIASCNACECTECFFCSCSCSWHDNEQSEWVNGEWLEGGGVCEERDRPSSTGQSSNVLHGTENKASSGNEDLPRPRLGASTATELEGNNKTPVGPRRRVKRREASSRHEAEHLCGKSTTCSSCSMVSSCCDRVLSSLLRFGFGALSQPIDAVQEYFGEEIAFYFAWLDFYSKWLLGPAIVGAGLFAYQMVAGTLDVPALPFYALFMSLWATLLLLFWRRRESSLASQSRQASPAPSMTALNPLRGCEKD